LALSVRLPWLGPEATTALRVSPSGSLSLPSTPGAFTVKVVSSGVL